MEDHVNGTAADDGGPDVVFLEDVEVVEEGSGGAVPNSPSRAVDALVDDFCHTLRGELAQQDTTTISKGKKTGLDGVVAVDGWRLVDVVKRLPVAISILMRLLSSCSTNSEPAPTTIAGLIGGKVSRKRRYSGVIDRVGCVVKLLANEQGKFLGLTYGLRWRRIRDFKNHLNFKNLVSNFKKSRRRPPPARPTRGTPPLH